MTEETAVARSGSGSCCGCLGLFFLIVGGCMYGICKDAIERDVCNQNDQIENTGFILLMIGAGIEGLSILICLLMCCCLAGAACTSPV